MLAEALAEMPGIAEVVPLNRDKTGTEGPAGPGRDATGSPKCPATWAFVSGDDGTRTHDPLLAKQVL